jgi:CBS domain-containing protein
MARLIEVLRGGWLMRVREVMSSPVVTVPPGMRLKEVADLLVEREISAVPVIEDGALVGIVARRDLIKVLARGDREIARDLEALFGEELGTPSPFRVTVHDGVVELSGPSDPTDRRLATLLARGVPGVVEIRFTEE